jgi:uncharacterized protein DUF3313
MRTRPDSGARAALKRLVAGAIVGAALAGCAAAPPDPGEIADDGLLRVHAALLDELYVAPNVSLGNYQRVMLDPIEVNFKEGWRKQHPDLRDNEFELLRTRLATALREKLVGELTRGGYAMAEAPAPDVLRLRVSIVDADFAAPEASRDMSTMTYSDGEMTLRVQGFDAPSGALVARARDHEEDPETRILQRADRVSAFVNAQRIFDEWARELRSALDVARVSAGARSPQQ